MKKPLFLVLCCLFMVPFFGCTAYVVSNVSVLHRIDHKPLNYAFKLFDIQKISLAYEAYQDLIRKELSEYQFKETSINKADVFIMFRYGMNDGREITTSFPAFVPVTPGGIKHVGGIVGSEDISETVFDRSLKLYIVEKDSMKPLYEASVKSSGSSSRLAAVMPFMIKALFKEFPGESGTNRHEEIPMR